MDNRGRWWKGKKRPYASKRMTEWNKQRVGELNPNWKGGITLILRGLRHTNAYRLWRLAVLERDNGTCVQCGIKEKTMHVDHILPFAKYPESRLDVNNGRTLCVSCHRKTNTYSRRKS